MTSRALVTIVIPTYNRADRLRRVLAALEAQTADADAIEVIVVSDGSTDDTDEVLATVRSRFAFRAVSQANAGPAAARNAGLALAIAPLVLFLDDDVIATPDLVATHLAAHERLGARAVVIGPMLTPDDWAMQPWVAWEQAMLEKQYEAMASGAYGATARQFYTGNASLETHEARDAGAFDPTFRRAEDVEFAYRLADRGLRFSFEPAAVGYHYAERSFDTWLGNASAYGRNDVVFARDRGQQWRLDAMAEEFKYHHPFVRVATRASLRWRPVRRVLLPALAHASRWAGRLRVRALDRALLSGAYNTAYYAGVADELGSAGQLLALIDRARATPRRHGVPRVGFLLEQSLGHVTHADNLHRLVPAVDAIDAEFVDLPYEPAGLLGKLPLAKSNWTVRAGLLARRGLRSLRKHGELDALFVHTQVPAVLVAGKMRRLPTVVSVDATPMQYDELGEFYAHDTSTARVERLKWRANRRAFHGARHVVTWSAWAKQGVVDGYGVDPADVTVIPPGVDPARWQRSEPRPATADAVRILFVGGDLARKGGDVLLRSFRTVADRPGGRPAELHLVTKSPVEPQQGVFVHAGMSPNSEELIALYHRCDIFALPTRGDCLPMVLSEAGAASMPLISTDVGAISEIVIAGETGLLVPVDDEDALTAQLSLLVDDDELRTKMGAAAERLVAERFDAAANALRLAELLRDVAARG